MKKLFATILIILSVYQSFAQTDSMNLKTGPLAFEAGDVEFIIASFSNQNIYDSFFNDLSLEYRAIGSAGDNTVISIDSVSINILVLLSAELRALSYSISKNTYSRINAAIRNCNNSFLIRQLDILDRKDEEYYDQIQRRGRSLLQ